MATSCVAPVRGLAEQRDQVDRTYWLWRRRSVRLRLLASGAASWVLHACILLLIMWGGETLVTKRTEPPRVDVVAAVGEAIGAPGAGSDGVAPSPREGALSESAAESDPSASASSFLPNAVPAAITDSLPKTLDLKLPGAEIVGPIMSGRGGVLGGTESGLDSGNGGRGGGGGFGVAGVGAGWSRTEFVGIHGSGSKFVYVIDHSGSMGQNDRLGAVKRELLASLAKLPAESQFQVIFYNLRPDLMPIGGKSQRLVFATDSNKSLASRYLESVIANGGTEHLPALKMALSLGPDVIFFLTDADDLSLTEVNEVTELNRGRATIHTIEFAIGPQPDRESMLQKMAQRNNGTYNYVDVGKFGRDRR
jgi:hypothetical protein